VSADFRGLILDALEAKLARAGHAREALDGATNLIASGIVDSFGFLELVAALEAKTGVEIDFDGHDPEQFVTLSGLEQVLAGIGGCVGRAGP